MDIQDPDNVEPARKNNPNHEDLRKATAAWIEDNPDIYAMFLNFAKEMAREGQFFSAKLLVERVRWECYLHQKGEYKLNNNYVAYIARRLIMDAQELVPFLRFRQTQW